MRQTSLAALALAAAGIASAVCAPALAAAGAGEILSGVDLWALSAPQ